MNTKYPKQAEEKKVHILSLHKDNSTKVIDISLKVHPIVKVLYMISMMKL